MNTIQDGEGLHSLCKKGDFDKVIGHLKKLKGKKLKKIINEQEQETSQALIHIAIINKHTILAKALINLKCDIEQEDEVKRTPLLYAARYGDMECFRALLEAGADVEATDGFCEGIYHLVVASDSLANVQLLKYMLENKIGSINAINAHGESKNNNFITKFLKVNTIFVSQRKKLASTSA